MLGIISVVVLAMFGLMLTTSYAWYSFEKGSTTFEVDTNNDEIEVSFLNGEYINTSIAVPIGSEDVDQYSDKHNFIIRTKNNSEDNEMVASVSLTDITINSGLMVDDLKIDLYYQGSIVSSASTTGRYLTSTSKGLASVTLANDVDNQFELRIYILDDDTDQSDLMGLSVQAKIQVNVISRLKLGVTEFGTMSDIYVSSITIDGESSNSTPSSGLYTMSATCTKGSSLTWDSLTRTITYGAGSYVNDSCSLVFTSSTSYPLLSTMQPGSYVRYVGSNGCEGKACQGQNANYVDDNDMGMCGSSENYKFNVNGWRIGYVKDSTAYLISAGAPECVNTYVDTISGTSNVDGTYTPATGGVTLSSSYYYGSGYTFNEKTGKFTLTGLTDSTVAWSSNYQSIVANTPYTCKQDTTATCSTLYEITSYYSSTDAVAYIHYNYDKVGGAPTHLEKINNTALKYCNKNFAYGGICNVNSAWSMNADDFSVITGVTSLSTSCYEQKGLLTCGYNNDLIDNGSVYWFASTLASDQADIFTWFPSYRYVYKDLSDVTNGVRPVLRLDSTVVVISGSGTYKDPYVISNNY